MTFSRFAQMSTEAANLDLRRELRGNVLLVDAMISSRFSSRDELRLNILYRISSLIVIRNREKRSISIVRYVQFLLKLLFHLTKAKAVNVRYLIYP